MRFIRKLPVPKEIKELYPLSERAIKTKAERDAAIQSVFRGESDKFIVVVGPCSADRERSVLKYLEMLRPVADEVKDKLVVIPRVFTNKPRTKGFGYMGMLHQPDPVSAPDLLKGVIAIRKLHLEALESFSFTCADELLYPDNYRYLSDLLSYVTVGARSVENQYHRLVASGLDIPVGMKNPLSGDTEAMLNAVSSARRSHAFLYRGWEVVSDGNPLSHAVLRGFKAGGKSVCNCRYGDLMKLYGEMAESKIEYPAVIVDVNHDNSGRDPFKQIELVKDVIESKRKDGGINKLVKGVMIESYIEGGAQEKSGGVFGKSITDACLAFEDTKALLFEMATRL